MLVSRIAVDLVAGSGLSFAARGKQALKGMTVEAEGGLGGPQGYL